MATTSESNPIACCTQRRQEVLSSELPLRCPPKDCRLWDGHPRVYLPIEQTGHALCPYCGTQYLLMPDLEEQ